MFNWLDHNFSISVDTSDSQVNCKIEHGDTVIMCILKIGKWCDTDFLPLTIDYFERSYAINKIPGGFIKKESRQRENEVLASRLIDRSIRPTIAPSFKFEISISCFVLSYSKDCPAEPLCITAASAALQAAGVPSTMVAGIKLFHSEKWTTTSSYAKSKSAAVVAGNNYGISSFEFSGGDLPTQSIFECLDMSVPKINSLIEHVWSVVSVLPKPEYAPPVFERNYSIVDANLLVAQYRNGDKSGIQKQKAEFLSKWQNQKIGESRWNDAISEILRQNLFWTNKRLDKRGFDDLRQMTFESPYLKKIHGSSVFSKGKTKCICAVTIGTTNDSQVYETLDGNENRKMILNYNFLSGEDRISGFSNRREVGHGNLARNAIKNFVSDDRFIRIVSEVISSDGSSSMATVCAGWLALRAAGIKISETIAGISVGLISKDFINKFIIDLTQIEDSISDMDLKIAGTLKGLTAIQIDLKVQYLPWEVFKKGLTYGFNHLKTVIQKIQDGIVKEHPKPQMERPKPQVAPVSTENTKPSEEPKDQSEQKKSKGFSFKLPEDRVPFLQKDLEKIRSETQSNIYVKGDRINVYTKNLEATITRILSVAYESPKELNFAKVDKISDTLISFTLLSGKKSSITKDENTPEVKQAASIVVHKGRKWTLFALLP